MRTHRLFTTTRASSLALQRALRLTSLPILLAFALLPCKAVAQDKPVRPLTDYCIEHAKGAEAFEARLIYGGPPGKPLLAAADGVVVFSDWLNGKGGYRALVLMVDYLLPGDTGASCLVAYRGEMNDFKRSGDAFKKGDRLGTWDRPTENTHNKSVE